MKQFQNVETVMKRLMKQFFQKGLNERGIACLVPVTVTTEMG
jgi:hypothetical protein